MVLVVVMLYPEKRCCSWPVVQDGAGDQEFGSHHASHPHSLVRGDETAGVLEGDLAGYGVQAFPAPGRRSGRC